jgi:hypothetical protein
MNILHLLTEAQRRKIMEEYSRVQLRNGFRFNGHGGHTVTWIGFVLFPDYGQIYLLGLTVISTRDK